MVKLKKTSRIILTAFLYLLVPIIVFILITSRWPVIGGVQSFVVLTGSMEPSLPTGSVVVTKPQNGYTVGDVIAFKKSNDQVVTHRIVELVNQPTGMSYRVKGDANNTADTDLVSARSVIGKEAISIPYVGRFAYFLRSVPGFLVVLVLPTLLFVVMEIVAIKNEMEKEIRKKVMSEIQTM